MESVKSVTVHYWAAAKAAAGVPEERLELPVEATLGDLTALVRARHGVQLDQVLAVCSVLIDGAQAGSRDPGAAPLPDGATVEFLPPFAGG
ncbi:MoaD/ThiS family protein [Nocardioides daejeonensis]|uniref:MoaD/ThiS family protein n=1 Tax=Nocardioides daejeonensis TaxID=1046556 RepID=UPI001EF611DE|nr:MoaD/ThiS family protein [Nocardioides daejeonensis]